MSTPTQVYVVSSSSGVQHVFADPGDAEAFAREYPDTRVSRHHVLQSMEDAVVIFERKVVVADGATVLDRTERVRQFVDDPIDAPADADVEYFLDDTDSRWHIIAFGIDREAVDARVQSVIDEVSAVAVGGGRWRS